MNHAVVASAVHIGQMLGSADGWRISAIASAAVVHNNSRCELDNPSITCCSELHKASRAVTTGTNVKFQAGGGEAVAHSNVDAPHGLSPAATPLRRLATTLTMNS